MKGDAEGFCGSAELGAKSFEICAFAVSGLDDAFLVMREGFDALVEGALEAGADGARLTGGGFGGSVVALVRKDLVETWCDTISNQFSKARILAVT